MIEIRTLHPKNLIDLRQVGDGYISDSKYRVTHQETAENISINLKLVKLNKPYVKNWQHDDETLHHYGQLLKANCSFGAYDDDLLVGILIAEPHKWNRSLWVWEFHVREVYRNKHIGKRLMANVVQKAKAENLRTIVCETQNTNVTAINVYRKLGFRAEGIDISYYSNEDYPDGEIAIFMKRRLP